MVTGYIRAERMDFCANGTFPISKFECRFNSIFVNQFIYINYNQLGIFLKLIFRFGNTGQVKPNGSAALLDLIIHKNGNLLVVCDDGSILEVASNDGHVILSFSHFSRSDDMN